MDTNVQVSNSAQIAQNQLLGEVRCSDLDKVCEISDINTKGFYVYKGLSIDRNEKRYHNKLRYIGTTIQIPADRFRWHKANGKDFLFEIIKICKDENEMLDTEFA